MSVSRYVMSDERSEVSNLTKLSRPPEGILDVDDRLRKCDCRARDEAGRERDGVRCCSCASDFGPRTPFGFACWGGDGVLRGSHCAGSALDVEGIGEATSGGAWAGVAVGEEGDAVVPFGMPRELLGAARVK